MDEHEDPGAGVTSADADVVESAVVPEGEFAVAVDAVGADAEVFADLDALAGWDGAGPGGPGAAGGAAADAAVRPLVVVVLGEGVELGLQVGEGAGAGLAGEPLLQRLVKPLHLSAGLRVVGPGVTQRNAERDGLAFQGDPAVAAVGAGEHGTVVGE